MRKQILLYRAIYPDTAAQFITELSDNRACDLTVLVNCPGGDPYSTYGMIAVANKMDNVCYEVHGQASSCAAYMLAGSPNKAENTCLDVSVMVFHRAASWMEKYPDLYTDAVKAELEAVNANLRDVLEKGIGGDNFKRITGTSFDDMFAMDKRLDVRVSAKMAKKMGIVGKIVPISSKIKAEIEARASEYHIAAFAEGTNLANINSQSNDDVMEITTLAALKAAYPVLVTEAENAAAATALANEKIRVEAWSAWNHVDAEAVKAGIASDKLPTPADVSNFQVKACSPDILAKMKEGNKQVTTDPGGASKSAKQLELDAFMAEVNGKGPAVATGK